MPKKTLRQVVESKVITRLASIAEFFEWQSAHNPDPHIIPLVHTDMSEKLVWGVKEAKTQLSTILHEASAGEIHFVTAGDGSAIVMMNAANLAEVMENLDERRGLTLADAVARLPYPHTELKPVTRRRHAPALGLLRRSRLVEHP